MSNSWLFLTEQSSYMLLECPSCSNQRVFKASEEQGELCWHCAICGNNRRFSLRRLDLRPPYRDN